MFEKWMEELNNDAEYQKWLEEQAEESILRQIYEREENNHIKKNRP